MYVFYKFFIAISFIALFIAERVFPKANNKKFSKRLLNNLFFVPVNSFVSYIIVIPITYYASLNHFWEKPDYFEGMPSIIIDFVILDLSLFLWHVANHRVYFLWRFHKVHHLDQELDTTSAIRFHFGEVIFSSLVRALVIMVFAIDFDIVILYEIIMLSCTYFHHSNVNIPPNIEKIIVKIIVTPSIHWVHHQVEYKNTNSNYATIFSFWDILFSTRSSYKRKKNMKIGLEEESDLSFIKLILKPFI